MLNHSDSNFALSPELLATPGRYVADALERYVSRLIIPDCMNDANCMCEFDTNLSLRAVLYV